MAQIFPGLLYLAQTSLQRNKFCPLFALKDLSVRFILSSVGHCSLLHVGINCKVKSQLQVILKPAEFLRAKKKKNHPKKQASLLTCTHVLLTNEMEWRWNPDFLFLKLCTNVRCGICCSKSYKEPRALWCIGAHKINYACNVSSHPTAVSQHRPFFFPIPGQNKKKNQFSFIPYLDVGFSIFKPIGIFKSKIKTSRSLTLDPNHIFVMLGNGAPKRRFF